MDAESADIEGQVYTVCQDYLIGKKEGRDIIYRLVLNHVISQIFIYPIHTVYYVHNILS